MSGGPESDLARLTEKPTWIRFESPGGSWRVRVTPG
jgi:hypothetical protein